MSNKASSPRPKQQVLLGGVYYSAHHSGVARYALFLLGSRGSVLALTAA